MSADFQALAGVDPAAELANYHRLTARVDAHAAAVRRRWPTSLQCRRGCDACCRHLSVFPVEAAALGAALAGLAPGAGEALRQRARRMGADQRCPLLVDRACALYAARPLICRTQGLPLLYHLDGRPRVDVCPLNFQAGETLAGEDLLDLDHLNRTLAAVNALFVKRTGRESAETRVSLAHALAMAPWPVPGHPPADGA
jgi:hypothetical protein